MKRTLLLLLALGAGLTTARAEEKHDPIPLGALFSGDFQLVDQNGRSRTMADFRGRFVLMFFGYTSCPDICPPALQTMADALAALGPDGRRVVPVFITVDPARDTPAVLKEYVANFGTNFVALTGTERQVAAAARNWRVHRRKIPHDTGGYSADHGSITYLMGPDGKFRTLFPLGTSSETMARRIRRYLDAETGAPDAKRAQKESPRNG